ncbi:DUF397 domain-containing protein [Streptomyces sp. HSW2009]|uniref:DUF397 domain-containing protein n=1 Tax=Streptomyces sp. HSW2009 TaxID=3142890 RepID=UPI0032EFB3DA
MSDAHEKAELYAADISNVTWVGAPSAPGADRVEVAFLSEPAGAVIMRNAADPDGPVLRYTEGEWRAFVLGVRDGEFDLS